MVQPEGFTPRVGILDRRRHSGVAHALAEFGRDGEFVISITAGKKAISCRTLAGWAHDIVGTSIDGFQLKRIRSGVETLLAAKGVSREARGHLQSRGLTGVQARHYDGHNYMPEKRRALEVLRVELNHVADGEQGELA